MFTVASNLEILGTPTCWDHVADSETTSLLMRCKGKPIINIASLPVRYLPASNESHFPFGLMRLNAMCNIKIWWAKLFHTASKTEACAWDMELTVPLWWQKAFAAVTGMCSPRPCQGSEQPAMQPPFWQVDMTLNYCLNMLRTGELCGIIGDILGKLFHHAGNMFKYV